MRKLLFLFLIVIFSIGITEAKYCDYIEDDCKINTTVNFALNDVATATNAGTLATSASPGNWRTITAVKKIAGVKIYEIHATLGGDTFDAQVKIDLNCDGDCSDSGENCNAKYNEFGETIDLVYNNEVVGTITVYHYPSSFDAYFAYNSKWDEVPAGAWVTGTLNSKWLYNIPTGACYSFTGWYYTETQNTGAGTWLNGNTVLNNAVKVQTRWSSGDLREDILEDVKAIKQVDIVYQLEGEVIFEECRDLTGNYIASMISTTGAKYPMKLVDYNDGTVLIEETALEVYAKNDDVINGILYDRVDLSTSLDYSCWTSSESSFVTNVAILKVKGNGGIWIKDYRVKINGFEDVVTDYTYDISEYVGETINITIEPLFDSRLAETFTIDVVNGENIIELNNYYYSVQLRAFYKTPMGNLKPISFKWTIEGDMKPDKNTLIGDLNFQGTAYSDTTVIIPAGSYNVSFEASILGFPKSDTQSVDLLDEQYYKYVTFYASLTDTEVVNGSSVSAILQVIINDQYGNDVNNATVKVYDGNSTLLANQITSDGQAIVGGLEIGNSYKVEVWIGATKKAERTVTITEASQTVIITVNVNEQEKSYLDSGGDAGIQGGTATEGDTHTVAQNIVLSILGSYGFWGLVILISITVLAAANGGEKIGLITFVAGLGVLTFVIPLLPQVIFVVVAVIAFILFGWQAVGKIAEGRS